MYAGCDHLDPEADPSGLDVLLDTFTRASNRIVQLKRLDQTEAGHVHDLSLGIDAFLKRHLTDEEDLVVPILLHHKLRG